MRSFKALCTGLLLLVIAVEAEAKKVTLKCSRGYSVDITFKVWYPTDPASFRTFHMTCPPTAKIDIPDGYHGISVDPGEGTMTAPDGTQTDLQLPSPVDNSPNGSDLGVAPWPPLFPGHHSYIGTSAHWEEDPQAPPFIQDGELLLGEYEDGAVFPLTVNILNSGTNVPISGAVVTAVTPGGESTPTVSTNGNGRAIINLPAGEVYQIKVDAANFLPQVSDEFMILGNHMWTMVMTPDSISGNRTSAFTWSLLIVSLLLLMLLIFARQRNAP